MASACATPSATRPREALLADCWEYMEPLTGDPAIDLARYEAALDRCAADKAALRAWAGELRQP